MSTTYLNLPFVGEDKEREEAARKEAVKYGFDGNKFMLEYQMIGYP